MDFCCRKQCILCTQRKFREFNSGLYAKHWGLPVKKFLASTNNNDVIPEFLITGRYNPRPSVQTYSNAMDVGAPSNFERMLNLYDNDVEKLRRDIEGISIDDENNPWLLCRELITIYDYEICPHTAVGIKAAEIYADTHKDDHITVLSTAHPGKFKEIFQKAVGHEPALPQSLLDVKDKEKGIESNRKYPSGSEDFIKIRVLKKRDC